MNATFRWYKSGKKNKLKNDEINKLIDAITLASKICPSIVEDDHLDVGIRVQWYWTRLRDMIEDKSILTRLRALSPAMKELISVE